MANCVLLCVFGISLILSTNSYSNEGVFNFAHLDEGSYKINKLDLRIVTSLVLFVK